MPTKKKRIQVTVSPELENALLEAAGGQAVADYIRDVLSDKLGVENALQHGGNRGTRQQRDAYSQWLNAQLLGDDGYDPLTDQEGEYSFEYWLENIYKGD